MGVGVGDLGFEVWGWCLWDWGFVVQEVLYFIVFRAQGSRFRAQGLGLRVYRVRDVGACGLLDDCFDLSVLVSE